MRDGNPESDLYAPARGEIAKDIREFQKEIHKYN